MPMPLADAFVACAARYVACHQTRQPSEGSRWTDKASCARRGDGVGDGATRIVATCGVCKWVDSSALAATRFIWRAFGSNTRQREARKCRQLGPSPPWAGAPFMARPPFAILHALPLCLHSPTPADLYKELRSESPSARTASAHRAPMVAASFALTTCVAGMMNSSRSVHLPCKMHVPRQGTGSLSPKTARVGL